MLDLAADRIRSFGPWPACSPVLLACSGGADSTFLALAWQHTLRETAVNEQEKLPEAVVVVVDHGHRPGSGADAEAAAAIYRGLGFDVQVKHAHAAGDANEADLRDARYRALMESAARHGARRILLAHHADDNAETVLLRILRGTGLPGLAGIPVRRMLAPGLELLRPLLDLRSAAIRKALQAMDQPWVEDLSNADPSVATRNLLRNHLLPELAAASTGDPVAALLRLSAEAVEWQAAKQQLLDGAGDFTALPGYLRRQAIRDHLQAMDATVSQTRLRNLEDALLKRGRAGVDQQRQLELQAGRLTVGSS
jgi:tRNA(Ile)-lysidine synthase